MQSASTVEPLAPVARAWQPRLLHASGVLSGFGIQGLALHVSSFPVNTNCLSRKGSTCKLDKIKQF